MRNARKIVCGCVIATLLPLAAPARGSTAESVCRMPLDLFCALFNLHRVADARTRLKKEPS